MQEQARKAVLDYFCDRHRLAQDSLPPGLADMICAATTPYLLMIECVDQMDMADPSSGLFLKLVDRSYGTVAAALTLVALSHLREAEILSRSVYESAVTTTYIARESPSLRLAQFFRAYVREEREQNRKWRNELDALDTEVQQDHRQRIDAKNRAMDLYEQFIEGYIEHCGIDPNDASKWPGLIDRLTALGRRVDYRTVYAAMCSQAHHDAEDILNNFWAGSMQGDVTSEIRDRIEREADTFSVFMVLFGLQWFAEATLSVCLYLDFPTAVDGAIDAMKRIREELELVAPHLETGEFPKNWAKGPAEPLKE